MVAETDPLLALLALAKGVPLPPAPRRRSHPDLYSDRLILKALVVTLVQRVWTARGLLATLAEPTPQMARVRARLTDPAGASPAGAPGNAAWPAWPAACRC
jgi:hypothetical protein